MSVYLDYAAATPVDPEVVTAMAPFFSDQFYNPSALYGPALEASRALESARAECAQLIGAKPSEIIFTAGGTEANNIAIHGVMAHEPGASIAYSAIEHDSVRRPAEQYEQIVISVSEAGIVDADIQVQDTTRLVSVMYANNEVGTVQPIRKIASAIETIRKRRVAQGNKIPLYFHVDAAQAGNYLDIHVHRLGVDLMTINGGKLYGPKQSGFLYVRSGIELRSLIQGGGQERNIRSGTENLAYAAGLACALRISASLRHEETARLRELQTNFIRDLKSAFPNSIVNGSTKHRLPNNVHITIPGIDNERVLMALDMDGIYAAAGSACSASHDEPSHVLAAMGCTATHIQSSIRFSMGRATTATDLQQVVAALQRIV